MRDPVALSRPAVDRSGSGKEPAAGVYENSQKTRVYGTVVRSDVSFCGACSYRHSPERPGVQRCYQLSRQKRKVKHRRCGVG